MAPATAGPAPMAHTPGQNAGREAVEVSSDQFWFDFERMQQLPAGFRHWLEYEANDTYLISSILQYHTLHGRTFAELERFMRQFSRNQYVEDYAWTGETPPQKGPSNEQLPKLRLTPVAGGQPGLSPVQVRSQAKRSSRRRASLAGQLVDNDADYYEW